MGFRLPNGTTPQNLQSPAWWARFLNSINPYQFSGTGSPEGVVVAPVGSLYQRLDGGAGTSLYVKESGTGSTGWTAK